jgi:hypothetical protein
MTRAPRDPHGYPPAWYVDPNGRGCLRWWDGERWGEATRPIQDTPAPPRTWQSQQYPPGQWQPWPDRLAVGHPSESATRIEGPSRYARDTDGHADRGGRRDVTPPVASRPAAARRSAPSRPSKANSAAYKLRRSALDRLWLSGLFAFSLVLFDVGFALDNGVLRLIALTAALFFGVGAAPLQLSERASLELRLCVMSVVGLSVPLIVAGVMVLAHLWHPVAVTALMLAAAFWVHTLACRRVLSGPYGRDILRLPRPRGRDFLDASLACGLIGTLLWIAGMAATGHVTPVGAFGFLPKAPVFWYMGLVLLVAGIILARGKSELQAAFSVVSLLAALTVTPAVVYGTPESPSAAKHIDLVQNVLQSHSLGSNLGIYQAYSALFSAVGWLCDVTGMHNAAGIATYWPFFAGLLTVLGLRFFFGQLTVSPYRIWIAIALVILANSVGQTYFSPQATGFALAMGVFGLALNRREIVGLSERGRLGLLLLAGCAMGMTHELSPYITAGVLVILVIFRIIGPWYVPAVLLVPAVIWVLLYRGDVSQFVSLSDIGNLANFEPPPAGNALPTTPGLERLPVVGISVYAMVLGIVILIVIAAVGLVRKFRNGAAWAFICCPSVGLIVIVANPYGQEGIFRAALFGLPWLMAVGTQAIPRIRSWLLSSVYSVVVLTLVATYLVSTFGLDNADVIRQSDYQAMLTYQATASPNSYMFDLSDGDVVLPGSLNFPPDPTHAVTWDMVITKAQAAITKPTPADAAAVALQYYNFAKNNDGETGDLYAVWSWMSVEYSADYGFETQAQAEAWRSAMLASPDWKVVYGNDGTYLFRVMPNASTPAKSTKQPSVKAK